jgi:hypothetical protein
MNRQHDGVRGEDSVEGPQQLLARHTCFAANCVQEQYGSDEHQGRGEPVRGAPQLARRKLWAVWQGRHSDELDQDETEAHEANDPPDDPGDSAPTGGDLEVEPVLPWYCR